MGPFLLLTACSTTAPWMRAGFAMLGYWGLLWVIRLPAVRPPDTRPRCGVAPLGTDRGVEVRMRPMTPPICPPGAPPGTPPTTPATPVEGGGASSSVIILTFSGILV